MARRKRKTGRKILVFVLILGGLGGLAAWSFWNQKEIIISVKTEKVGRRNLTEEVVATGRIQPELQVKISPEVSGEIVELAVKEGQRVKPGDLLLKIKPDFYEASKRSAEASYKSSVAGRTLAEANLERAQIEFARIQKLHTDRLVPETDLVTAQNSLKVAAAQVLSAGHQTEVAQAALARADEELRKTTIFAPLGGTISKLNSEQGERVVGTATMAGTEVMIISDLETMEAVVEIGEMDIILIQTGQKARLDVEAFREREFFGTVTEIANTATTRGQGMQQEATKFEVRVRVGEPAAFRPGMSVTAYIETRHRTNVIAVPIQSVTTRLPKKDAPGTNTVAGATNSVASSKTKPGRKNGREDADNAGKPVEVVFVRSGEIARMIPIERGISDDDYVEITAGLEAGAEVITGGYKAINRELEDGKKIQLEGETEKQKKIVP